MDNINMFLRLSILASMIAATMSICETLNNTGDCNYVVKCERLAGSVPNPSCDWEPYVTFIIDSSNTNYLSSGFFSSTNFDARVREFKGINNAWYRIDGSAFRYYPKCLRMDLSNNQIENIAAEAFRNLISLLYLNLSGNNIRSLNIKAFLISDSGNNNIAEIDLSNNKLESLGSELNEVGKLKKLSLQNNRLSSISDDAFMNLQYLGQLYLQNNYLTAVNLSLIHLKSLTILDVSNNQLIKLSGYEINRLSALVNFNISHNKLTLVESNCFNQAFALEIADFSYNYINMTIETVMFANNVNLVYLNFYNNRIVGIQDNAFKFCNLNYLNLEKNNFTGEVNAKTLVSKASNMTELDLSQQHISVIKDNAFSDMGSLLNLNLSRNVINIVDNSSFTSSSLNVLDLSYNKISYLYFFKNCLANLTYLYLNNNNISELPKYTFENQIQLKVLDLSMNNIINIEAFSLPLQNLQYINIAGNRINGAIKQNVFSPAKYLRFLDLSYFNITKIDISAFVDLPVLAKLNLSQNYINNIDVDSFKNVNNLYSLDLSFNNVSEFKFNMKMLPNLKALYLSHNNITDISGLFTNISKLTYLDLTHNSIQNISEIGSNVLPNITALYLDNNKIKDFNNPKTNSLTTLIDLGLSSNNISKVNLSYFKELLSVDLSNNHLTYINMTLLEKNEFLQALDVSRNKISDLPPGTFQFMKNLKLLNLSSNYLTKLRYGSLKGLHKTEILDLSRNKITQVDVDIFHECDELKTLIIDYNYIKTFDVERLILIALKKLRTLSIGGNPISCKAIVHNIKSANTTFYAIRQVEVTSIDKIYHEDNVHGIKCGDTIYPDPILETTEVTVATTPDTIVDKTISSFNSSVVVLIWCTLLTAIIVGAGVLAYMKLYKKRVFVVNSSPFENSIDLNGSDFQRDLLG